MVASNSRQQEERDSWRGEQQLLFCSWDVHSNMPFHWHVEPFFLLRGTSRQASELLTVLSCQSPASANQPCCEERSRCANRIRGGPSTAPPLGRHVLQRC